jgi:hypothetical protein
MPLLVLPPSMLRANYSGATLTHEIERNSYEYQ